MARGRRGKPVHGMVLLDKPAGLSSNQSLQRARRMFDAAKAGHTGNLDPFATGMLPLCFGEATKTAAYMLEAEKVYHASAQLGVSTTTGDIEGETEQQLPVPDMDRHEVEAVLAGFEGEIEQVPPMYSALKHEGRPLYRLAREGKVVERKPRRVKILEIRLTGWSDNRLEFRVRCSKGTYVRTLAEDIARKLGTCAHLVALRRLSVWPFLEEDMVTLPRLEQSAESGRLLHHLLPVDAGLANWPQVTLSAVGTERFRHGRAIDNDTLPAATSEGRVRVFDPEGALLGLGEITEGGRLEPRRVFNLSS